MREPLRFSARHWWNVVTAMILVAGVTLWRLGLVDGRLAAGILVAWVLAGRLMAPAIIQEHLGFLDRHVFNDYSKARSRYRKAVDTGKATADGMCALASLCYSEGDTAEAARLLKEASARRPEDPYAIALLSRVLSSLGRYGEAVAEATRLQGISGRSLGPLRDLALADALKAKGDAVAAASAYQRAAEAAPALPGPRIGLAEVYLGMGKPDDAHREAQRALDKSPANPDALYWVGKATEAKGDPATAARLYRSALEARSVGDRSYLVPYRDVVRAVSAASEAKPPSLGEDVR